MSDLLTPAELEARLREVGARRYHNLHPFHAMLHGGTCSRQTYELGGPRVYSLREIVDLVATLRVLADHRSSASLARLAALGPDGLPLVPAAHPEHWWGMREPSPGAAPVRPVEVPVALSASAVAGFQECPLRWFLERGVPASLALDGTRAISPAHYAAPWTMAVVLVAAAVYLLRGVRDQVF